MRIIITNKDTDNAIFFNIDEVGSILVMEYDSEIDIWDLGVFTKDGSLQADIRLGSRNEASEFFSDLMSLIPLNKGNYLCLFTGSRKNCPARRTLDINIL